MADGTNASNLTTRLLQRLAADEQVAVAGIGVEDAFSDYKSAKTREAQTMEKQE